MAGDYREWEFVVVESPQASMYSSKDRNPEPSHHQYMAELMLLQ